MGLYKGLMVHVHGTVQRTNVHVHGLTVHVHGTVQRTNVHVHGTIQRTNGTCTWDCTKD